ncbi:hypothetical protein V5D56_14400 [Cellulosimicrobium sp. PMB13]|uniref:hypothetical protein n=1 Tax=Cellulosimicrobium sp. PMB13 TaxID=3120158 RepID=UPI003F4B6449
MLTLCSWPGAPWLPPGGRADVVLLDEDVAMPEPTALVRLLIRDDAGRVFCVPRTGGRPGWDLPTRTVGDEGPGEALDGLVRTVLGRPHETTPLGFVRNTVPAGTTYAWPAPVAHFAVHRVLGSARPRVDGTWFDAAAAREHLGERHWWPLVAVERDAVRAMTHELMVAWGLWLHDIDRDRDRLTGSATEALVLGMDSPSLRELAGLHRDEQWPEFDALIGTAVSELGLPALTRELALRAELVGQARRVVAGPVERRVPSQTART